MEYNVIQFIYIIHYDLYTHKFSFKSNFSRYVNYLVIESDYICIHFQDPISYQSFPSLLF